MEPTDVIEFARRSADPAVTVMMPVPQPVAAHPDLAPRLRKAIDQAVDVVVESWGSELAAKLRTQLGSADAALETPQQGHGLAILATRDDCRVLRLPFAVDEQVVVGRTFAIRQLVEGLARHPRYRVLVLDGHRAHLFEGRGDELAEVTDYGFPVVVDPPHEWDTPKRDLPIHEGAEDEEYRVVHRAVNAALTEARRRDPLPVVVTGTQRELAFFEEVTSQREIIAGTVHGSFSRSSMRDLAEIVRPALERHLERASADALARLEEAYGQGRAVTDLVSVREAACAGRGHELLVETGPTAEAVNGAIAQVLLAGGTVRFVKPGALGDYGRVALLLRYAAS